MATSKLPFNFNIAVIFLLIIIFQEVQAHQEMVDIDPSTLGSNKSLLQTVACGPACNTRCRLSSRPNLCKRACGTCCARCNCVPPGTSGNQGVCPCYYNQTTRGGKRKCP